MTEESEHYMERSKVHKSLATSLDPEPYTRDNILQGLGTQSSHHDLLCRSTTRRELLLAPRP
jgi:hypothetical protein